MRRIRTCSDLVGCFPCHGGDNQEPSVNGHTLRNFLAHRSVLQTHETTPCILIMPKEKKRFTEKNLRTLKKSRIASEIAVCLVLSKFFCAKNAITVRALYLLPAKVSFESGYAGSFQFRRFCGRAGENLKLPPKHMILSNLAVNEAPHGFASPCEICRLPPKVSKYLNLAVNEAPHGFASLCKTCRLPPKVSKHLNLAVNTYETVQTNY